MAKRYVVRLTCEERSELEDLVRKGKRQAYRIKHANILLAVDADGPAWSASSSRDPLAAPSWTARARPGSSRSPAAPHRRAAPGGR